MAKRKWYVVTVGRDVGVFSTWLEAGALVKGVPNAIYQSFLTREEATRMFTEEQTRGRTRIVDPDREVSSASPAATQAHRARNRSAPTPRSPPTSSMFTMHHLTPPSVHHITTTTTTTTTGSWSNNSPHSSPMVLSDRRAPIVSATSHSSPAARNYNPRSGLDVSPSLRRFQIIKAVLEQEATNLARSKDQIPSLNSRSTGLHSNGATSGNRSSRLNTQPLQRASPPDVFGSFPTRVNVNGNREAVSAPVGFEARASSSSSRRGLSPANDTTTTCGARTSNSTAETSFPRPLPSSSQRQISISETDTVFGDDSSTSSEDSYSPTNNSYASPRVVIETPDWLAPYPTARTPSPGSSTSDSDSGSSHSQRSMHSPEAEVDELLSPLRNVNLSSFSLDNNDGCVNTAERRTPTSSRYYNAGDYGVSTASRQKVRSSQGSPSPLATDRTPRQFDLSRTPSRIEDIQQLNARRHRQNELGHDSDPRSPILNLGRPLACESISLSRPSPRFSSKSLTGTQLSVNGHGSSLLFMH